MSRETWNQIQNSKHFYVSIYRRLIRLLLFSVALNIVLSYGAAHIYLNRGSSVFFSSNGETPPVQLSPMDAPNESSVSLLGDDPSQNVESKALPE